MNVIRLRETPPWARRARYRALLAAYSGVQSVGTWMRRRGSALSWWSGERVHELSTGRARR